jgi:outer membrane protein
MLDADTEQAILASNEVFPFDFEKQPFSLAMRLTMPIFQGLSRQRQIEEAGVQARAAIHARRAGELGLRTEITAASGNLLAAFDVVEIEARNRELAVEQLDFAQERYRLGAAPLLELLDAQGSAATAERDYLNAVYDFHGALVELERASGLRLRPAEVEP